MLIYILNILSLFIWKAIYDISGQKEKWKKIIIIGIILQFSIIQGIRSSLIGTDTENYVHYYEYVKNVSYSFLEWYSIERTKFEPGWILLMEICSFFHMSSQMFLFTVSLIINSLLGYFIYRNSKDFIFSFWLFICLDFFTLSFTMLRQMIAILIVANTFIYLKNRELKKYCIGCFIALLFHKTSILFLFIYPTVLIMNMLDSKLEKRIGDKNSVVIGKFLFLIFILLFMHFGAEDIIYLIANQMYGYYTSFKQSELGGLWFELLLFCIIFILFEKFITDKNELRYYQIYAIFAVVLQYCTTYISQFSRGTFYFSIIFIISIPFVCSNFKNIKTRLFTKYVIMILMFIQYIYFSLDVYNLVPYLTFWQ